MPQQHKLDADVAVIGLGAVGSMSLWRLAERGVSTIGFEQFDPAHDRGSSHGESRITRSAPLRGHEYHLLVRRAVELWRELEGTTGARVLKLTGALMIGPPDGDLIRGTLADTREYVPRHEVLDRTEMGRRHTQHRLNPGDVAVYHEPAGILFPEACILAAAQRATSLGAQLITKTKVDQLMECEGRVKIYASGRLYTSRHAIVSVGPWLGAFLPELSIPVEVARQVLVWLPVRDPGRFLPELFPTFIRDIGDGHIRYGFPTLDGETIKLAVHQEGDVTTADNIDRKVHERDLKPIYKFVECCMNGVERRVARMQVCMYTNTPDRHFLIGQVPGRPWMTLLSACSGHGFKFSSAIGDVAADLATTGRTDYSLGCFAPDRYTYGGAAMSHE